MAPTRFPNSHGKTLPGAPGPGGRRAGGAGGASRVPAGGVARQSPGWGHRPPGRKMPACLRRSRARLTGATSPGESETGRCDSPLRAVGPANVFAVIDRDVLCNVTWKTSPLASYDSLLDKNPRGPQRPVAGVTGKQERRGCWERVNQGPRHRGLGGLDPSIRESHPLALATALTTLGPKGRRTRSQDPGRGWAGRTAWPLCLWVEGHRQDAMRSRDRAKNKYPSLPPPSSPARALGQESPSPHHTGHCSQAEGGAEGGPEWRVDHSGGWTRVEGGPGAVGGNPPRDCGVTDDFRVWGLTHTGFWTLAGHYCFYCFPCFGWLTLTRPAQPPGLVANDVFKSPQ